MEKQELNREEYLKLIGAALLDAEQDQRQALYAFENPEAFLERDAQALYGVTWEDVKERGTQLWERVSPRLYGVFCNPENEQQRVLADLIKSGSTEVAGALAGALTTYLLGLVPAIAVGTVAYFLAKFILNTFFEQAYTMGCDTWKETLPAG